MPATLLETLWAPPARWTDLIAQTDVYGAVQTMVTYENLAKNPHVDGWLGVSGQLWEDAFRFAVICIQETLATRGKLVLDHVMSTYDQRMAQFGQSRPAILFNNQWSYAIGIAGTKIYRHPFHFNAVDKLRWKYLPEWGWGSDPRVGNYLSMGALRMKDRTTGRPCWKAVKGTTRSWVHVDPRSFDTEQQALDCARHFVETRLLAPPGRQTISSAQNLSQGQE